MTIKSTFFYMFLDVQSSKLNFSHEKVSKEKLVWNRRLGSWNIFREKNVEIGETHLSFV